MPQLSQSDVAKITEPGLFRFDRGLYLQVAGPNAKSWIYRYTLTGRSRWMGLGSARDITLAKARKEVERLRVTNIAQKIDPLGVEENRKAEERAAKLKAVPFRERAEQYMAAHREGWRNAKHRDQWLSSVTTYVFPLIGDLPANSVTAAHVVDILRPIWTEKAETARRVRGRIEAILDYAADPDDLTFRNPATMTEQLLKKLPKLGRSQRAKHHPSLPYTEIKQFMSDLRARDGMASKALEFAILTAGRTTEVIESVRSEINAAERSWTVPGERMKNGLDHRVPLSTAALAVLDVAKKQSAGTYLFPALPVDQPLSTMAMLALLRRMGRSGVTVHGFRSTFKDWARECTNFPDELSEAALAHTIKDKTMAAYARGDLFERRRELMDAWAAFCETTPVS